MSVRSRAKKQLRLARAQQVSSASPTKARVSTTDAVAALEQLVAAGFPSEAELEIARQQRLEAFKAHLTGLVEAGRSTEAIDKVMDALAEAERLNSRLAVRVMMADRYRFGRRTEKLSRDELKQLCLALGGDDAAASAPEPNVPAPLEPEQVEEGSPADEPTEPGTGAPPSPKRRKRVRRMRIAPEVERDVTKVPVPDEERTCAICGQPKSAMGQIDHEIVEYVPAKLIVRVEQREKLACNHCHKDVSVAPRSMVPDVTRKVDASLLGRLVAAKAALSLPLERQRKELGRLGLDVPDKTLQSYWAYTLDLLEPVAVAALSTVFGKPIVGADDTRLKTLDKTSKNGSFRGHLWCFVGTDGVPGGPEVVGYGYTPSWDATEILDWFSAMDGYAQVDGYAGYSREVEDDDGQTVVAVPPDKRLGCGMHIRSKFHAALLAKDKRAAVPLKLFADIYEIEADCKARQFDALARGEERRGRSLPLLDELDAWVDETHPKLLPKSALRRATTYAINQREYFRRCFSDGRFEIDNGRTERRIRLFAVGRRNFLFTGSPRGGQRLAVAFTLVDNCLMLGVDPERYLVDIIRKIEAGLPLRRLSELVPWRWAAEHSAQKRPE